MKSLIKLVKEIVKSNETLLKAGRHVRAIIPYKYRKLDKEFWSYYNLLIASEGLNLTQLKNYQFVKLKALLENVYANSCFYKKKFDEYNFNPESFKSLDDMSKIPILTKDEVRLNWKSIVLKGKDIRYLQKALTSGTTGKSLTTIQDKRTDSREWASICYQWRRVGYMPGDGRIELRGVVSQGKDYEYLPDEKVLRINIVKLNNENLNLILQKMRNTNYKFLHGYPAAIMKFAKLLEERDIKLNQIDGIMLASEAVISWQLNVIDRVFDCKKIAHYGQAEKVGLGAWNNSRIYEFLPTYSIVEIDPENNELIGTSLINEIMPLIRYRTGDLAFDILEDSEQSSLFPKVGEISGRIGDITYNANGEILSPAIVTFPFNKLIHISNVKIIQKEIGKIQIFLEIQNELHKEEIDREIENILKDLKTLYGLSTNIEVIRLKEIEPETNGKYRWITCEVTK